MKIAILLEQLENLKGISNFEYLVFRVTNGAASTDFTEDEAARIYEVISTLPFPLNTNPMAADTIKRHMAGIPHNLHIDEKLAVQAALKNISEDLVVLPFPKSLMQFYFAMAVSREKHFFGHIDAANSPAVRGRQSHIHNAVHALLQAQIDIQLEKYREQPSEIESINEDLIGNPDMIVSTYLREGSSSVLAKSQLQANKKYNKMWLGLNKSLVKEIIDAESADLKNLYQILAKDFVNIFKNDELIFFYYIYKDKSSKILDLFRLEIDIMFNPKFANYIALYRGTKNGYLGDIETYRIFNDNNSLSFGNGLCEGLLKDTGACALKHLLEPALGEHIINDNLARGYVVFVDIPSFLNNELERALYWIPPLTSIARTLGKGELFHARTLGRVGLGNSMIGCTLHDAIQEIGHNKHLKETSLMSWQMFVAMMSRNIRDILTPHLSTHSMNLTPTGNDMRYKRDVLSLPSNSTNCTIDDMIVENWNAKSHKKLRYLLTLLKTDKISLNSMYHIKTMPDINREPLAIEHTINFTNKSNSGDYGFKAGFFLNRKNGLF
jgi:hypothetical protein